MNANEILNEILWRLEESEPEALILSAARTRDWPEGLLDSFLTKRILREVAPADAIECPHCFDGHLASATLRHGLWFIVCSEAGLVKTRPEGLRRLAISPEGVARFVAAEVGCEGLVRERVRGRFWTLGTATVGGQPRQLALYRGWSWSDTPTELEKHLSSMPATGVVLTFLPTEITDVITASLDTAWRCDGRELQISSSELVRQLQSCTPPGTPEFLFQRRGRGWTCAFGGAPFLVRRLKGMEQIFKLLQQPDQFIAADKLAYPTGPSSGLSTQQAEVEHSEGSLEATDVETVREVRRALRTSKVQNDRAEKDALERYLSSTSGLGDRVRQSSSGEQARTAVTKAIDRAIDEIGEGSPEMARHLNASITKGTNLVYSPSERIPWRF